MVSLSRLSSKVLLVFLLSSFLITGCSFIEKSGAWIKPEVKVIESRLAGLTLSKAILEVELEILNPNYYSVPLGALDFQLDLQGAKILEGKQSQDNKLAAGETVRVVLPLDVEFDELGRFVSNLDDLNELAYQVAGGMTFDLPVAGPLRVPYQVKGSIPIPRVPSFKLAGVQQKRLSLTGADLLISVELDNPNTFDLLVNKLQYSVALNGHSVTAGGLSEQVKVAAESNSKVDIPVKLSFGISSARAFYDMLSKGGKVNYQLDLNSELGSSLPVLSQFPFDAKHEGKVRLGR